MGRFLNADNYPTTGQGLLGNNMFSYCGNNPTGRKDDCGELWHLAIGVGIGLLTQYAFDVASNFAQGKEFAEAIKPSSTWADYGSAAISGALAASGIGLGASIVANAGLSGMTYLANCGIKGEDSNLAEFTVATVAGAASGVIGGSGANGAKLRGVSKTAKHVISRSSSAKKVAMYTAKTIAVKKTIAVSTTRTIVAGLSANYVNSKRKQLAKLLGI